MAFRVAVQPLAEWDIDEAALYIAQRGNSERARSWREDVLDVIEELGESPEKGLSIPESRRLDRDYRQIHFHSHRIVYFIDEPKETVVVVRVYHGARRPLRPSDL